MRAVGRKPPVLAAFCVQSGGGGIRTLVRGLTPETVFETAAFNHSATPPSKRRASPDRLAGRGRIRLVSIAYRKGLHELGDRLFAYLQPDGTWGWSNAGLIAADGTSLLVDTLFDLELTREMLGAMRRVTDTRPIDA